MNILVFFSDIKGKSKQKLNNSLQDVFKKQQRTVVENSYRKCMWTAYIKNDVKHVEQRSSSNKYTFNKISADMTESLYRGILKWFQKKKSV